MSRPASKVPSAQDSVAQKSTPSKSLDLSLKGSSEPLEALPTNFKEDTDDLRKLNLSGQTRLGKELGSIRFAGETLTWLNLSGIDCSNAGTWLWLKMMKTLFVLTMSNCKLEVLPKELATVTSLKALVASHNQLTSPSLAHLSGLANLNSLILSDNELTSLPSSITTLKSLKKLSLANNKLRSDSFPDLSPLRALEEIRINGNAAISTMPEGLVELPVLSMLEMSNTSISNWTEVDKLKGCQQLVNLGLKGTPLAKQADYTEKVRATLPKLRILDNNRFDPKFLQRKEKLKAKQAVEAGQFVPLKPERKAEAALGSKPKEALTRPLSEKQLGKQKAVDQDRQPVEKEEAESPAEKPRKARKRKRPSSSSTAQEGKEVPDEPTVLSDEEAGEQVTLPPPEGPKKKRSRVRKRLEREAAARAAGIAQADGSQSSHKPAMQVGGSLSAPAESKEAEKPAKQDISEDLLKARSSVVGIVEANKGSKKGSKAKQVSTGGGDVLALLQQQQASKAVVSGWD